MGGRALHEIAFDRSTLPSAILDTAGRVVDVNDAYLAMSGRTRATTIGASTLEMIHADELPGVMTGLDHLMRGSRAVRHRRRHKRADDSWISVEVVSCLMPNPDDEDLPLILVQILDHDVDALKIDLNDELVSRQLYQPAGDAACLNAPDGTIAFVSPSFEELLGRSPGWAIGRLLTDPDLAPVCTDGNPLGPDDDPALRVLHDGGEFTTTLGILTGSGERRWLTVVAGAVDREALPARMSLRDITDLVEAQREARRLAAMVEEQLAHRANHDDLTGLTARRIVMGKLDDELNAGRPMSVVFVDLDDFKSINDDHGHLFGDDILIGVADRLTDLAPPSVTVGRAGGDEFIAVTRSVEDAENFAMAVDAAASSDGGLVPGSPRRIGASVGSAHSKTNDDRARLLTRADRSMYEIKRARRSNQADATSV